VFASFISLGGFAPIAHAVVEVIKLEMSTLLEDDCCELKDAVASTLTTSS